MSPAPVPPKRHPITHVIFDCDGILVDSGKVYELATNSTLNDIIKVCPRYESRVYYELLCGLANPQFHAYLYDTYVAPLGNSVDGGRGAKEGQGAQLDKDGMETLSPPPSLSDPSNQKGVKGDTRQGAFTKAEFIQIYDEQEALFMQMYGMEPVAGVEKVLNYLKNVANVPLALATNAERSGLRTKLIESESVALQAIRDYFVDPVNERPPIQRRGQWGTGSQREALGLRG